MNKIDTILDQFKVNFSSYERIKEESFASEVYLVKTADGEKILKFGHSEVKFWREVKTIEFLSAHLPVPEILKLSSPSSGMNGAFLMKKISGHSIPLRMLNSDIVKKCGNLLGKLHSIPIAGLGYFEKEGFLKVPFANWWEYRKDLVLGAWTRAIEQKVDQDFLDKSSAFLNRSYAGFSDSVDCFIHCDFRPGNILEDAGQVMGLIDFESSRTGDPAYDFIKFYEAIGKTPLWQSFLDGYQEVRELPDLEKSLPYYEFELNYGFLQWAALRSDETLFNERLALAKSLLSAT